MIEVVHELQQCTSRIKNSFLKLMTAVTYCENSVQYDIVIPDDFFGIQIVQNTFQGRKTVILEK